MANLVKAEASDYLLPCSGHQPATIVRDTMTSSQLESLAAYTACDVCDVHFRAERNVN